VQGITPLMAAAFEGNREVVALLIAHHADPDSTDRVGKTAMEYASGRGHAAVVEQLLDAGVDVNAAYHNHLTALMWAAGYDQTQTVSLLLARGANRDLRDDRGMTARDIAEQTGSTHAALLLSGH
jgi:ankyrin repeat protein